MIIMINNEIIVDHKLWILWVTDDLWDETNWNSSIRLSNWSQQTIRKKEVHFTVMTVCVSECVSLFVCVCVNRQEKKKRLQLHRIELHNVSCCCQRDPILHFKHPFRLPWIDELTEVLKMCRSRSHCDSRHTQAGKSWHRSHWLSVKKINKRTCTVYVKAVSRALRLVTFGAGLKLMRKVRFRSETPSVN